MASCERGEIFTPIKITRLKTYTTEILGSERTYVLYYNNFNKIDSVVTLVDDSFYRKTICIYKPDHSLDSLDFRVTRESTFSKWNIEGNNTVLFSNDFLDNLTTYAYSNNFKHPTKVIHEDGSYDRYVYSKDSVLQYFKQPDDPRNTYPEVLKVKYIISPDIKNPFKIPGFETEQPIMYILFNNLFFYDTYLPNAYTKIHSYQTQDVITTCTYEGNMNGYPLKRIFANGFTETFTYEEI